ncbi:unnamed protein product, partial [Rotaria magnacalcarata]
MELRAELRE